MEVYNGMYRLWVSVVIDAPRHDVCNSIAKQFRDLAHAWNVSFSEYKSARKGPVLKREIQFVMDDFSHNIIIFSESVNCIVNKLLTYKSDRATVRMRVSAIPEKHVINTSLEV